MQRQAPTPSHHYFLQAPTYRRLYPQFCKLQLARKHQIPSIFCRHQPTGGSYLSQLQLTSIKLQLDREAPTSLLFQNKTLADLPWISDLFCTFFSTVHKILYQTCIISAQPLLLLYSAPPYSHSSCSLLILFNSL